MEIQDLMHSNRSKMGIGFFFLSLGTLATLITTIVSFLGLLFETLDKKFPDVLNATYSYGYNTAQYDSMRASLATLIIFFPIFLVLTYFWHKVYKKGVSHIDETIRKWMIYLILFLSALTIAIDLVTLVRYFISGEITNRFLYKVAITLLTAIFVGGYYFLVLNKKEKIWKFNIHFWSMLKGIVWVGLAIWFAFCVMGSPWTQRSLRLDEKRMQDLQGIQWQIINFWQQKERLPVDLKELVNPISGYSLPVDPDFEKGINYEYNILDAKLLKFELCATFAMPIPKGWQEYSYGGVVPLSGVAKDVAVSEPATYPYPGGGTNESWSHEAGHACFERTIDKEIYPPFSKTIR